MARKLLTTRLISLDAFRGLTIAGMILVNSPGNKTAYDFLEHSVWNGCTLADLVFPFFVFIMGVSLVFSLSKAHSMPRKKLALKIIRRALIIFAIGLFLNLFPHFDFEKVRILGVLQRIAICYLVGAFLFIGTRVRTQIIIFLGLLLGYWLLMVWVPVPGFGTGDLSPEGNLAAYIDRWLLSGHLYTPKYDPEGLLSTLPAIATTLLGNLTGVWLLSGTSKKIKAYGLVLGGVVCCVIGWVWGWVFPINKALWTSSYVLWTGGLALIVLSIFYGLIEIKRFKAWSKPLEILGMNAIAAYFLHIFFLKIQSLIHLTLPNGETGSLRLYLTAHLFGWTSSPQMASLLYAVSYVVFWLVILSFLYRKKIFIKI